jgi:hypothetical protein
VQVFGDEVLEIFWPAAGFLPVLFGSQCRNGTPKLGVDLLKPFADRITSRQRFHELGQMEQWFSQ